MNRSFDSSFRFASLDDAELDAVTGGGDVMPGATETFQLAAGLGASPRWNPSASPSSLQGWSGPQQPLSELAIIGDYGHGPAIEHLTGWDPSQATPHDVTGAQGGAVSDQGGGSYAHPYGSSDLGESAIAATASGAHSGYGGLLEQMGIDPNAVPVQGSSGGDATPDAGTAGFAAGDGGCYSGGGQATPAVSDAGSNGCNDAPEIESSCGGGGRHC